jgi:hypothetical protein
MHDSIKRSWNYNWIVLGVTVIHLNWAIILLFISEAPLDLIPFHFFFNSRFWGGMIYLAASLLVVIPFVYRPWDDKLRGFLCVIPQQILLFLSAYARIEVIMRGIYPNGFDPKYGEMYIYCQQLWPLVGIAMHTVSVIDWFVWSRESARREIANLLAAKGWQRV